ncbi:LTA synthase family protein [Nitrospirota bacterium]
MILKRKLFLYLTTLFLLVGALSAGRIFFYIRYLDSFRNIDTIDIIYSFLYGIRFDISATCMVTIPFIILFLLPIVSRIKQVYLTLSWSLLLWHLILIGYVFIDVLYYSFALRHVTFEIQNTWQETDVLVKIGLMEYLPESIGFIVFMILYAFIFHRVVIRKCKYFNDPQRAHSRPVLQESAALVIAIVLSIIFFRGGFQLKPLAVNHAFFHERMELGVLSLNGVFTTLDTLYNARKNKDPLVHLRDRAVPEDMKMDVPGLFKNEAKIKETPGYPLYRSFKHEDNEQKPLNVVLIIMESWTGKFMGSLGGYEPSATPFFDKLSQKGVLFKNCLANAQRSIEGLPAIMASLPSWKGMTLSKGGLLYQTRFKSIANIFNNMGYDTVFYHGARRGSMGIEGMVKRMGFKSHVSMEDFTFNDNTYDGIWGVYDDVVFRETSEKMAELQEPFLGVLYSLSSHTPYSMPEGEFNRYSDNVPNANYLNSLYYSDYALKEFFRVAHEKDYFRNTLFVITADHTEGSSGKDTLQENFHIPCFLYSPGSTEPSVIETSITQLDLIPTILDYMKVSEPFTGWGKSAFSNGDKVALIPFGNMFIYVREPYMLTTSSERPFALVKRGQEMRNLMKENNPEMDAVAERMYQEFLQYITFSYKIITENRLAPLE